LETTISLSAAPFNLDYTLDCGQVFRWNKRNEWWYGVVDGSIIKMKQKDDQLIFDSSPPKNPDFMKQYLRLHDDLPEILLQINRDEIINNAIKKFCGLHLVNQDPWECLISYVCSRRTKIKKIKTIVYKLSRLFGEKLVLDDYIDYSFPKPETMAKVDICDLIICDLTFGERQASEIHQIANKVCAGELDFGNLRELNYLDARRKLLSLPGVGMKVADCVLLFSLNKLEAFPIDTWVKKVLLKFYGSKVSRSSASDGKSLTPSQYDKLRLFARYYFGKYAGYAQEYLYHYIRTLDLNFQ
jgi:N-glycosylase/DNA lyase